MADDSKSEHGILHLIGHDRVGILQDAAVFVSERGAVVEEGISHTLSTEAVVLLFIAGQTHQLDLIEHDTPRLGESLKLLTLFTRIKGPGTGRGRDALPLTLRLSSPDFAGLLSAMTRFFTRHGLSIIAHHTHKTALPLSQGLTTYTHRFTVLLPSRFDRKAFLAELDKIADEMNFLRDSISHTDFY